MPQPTIKNFGLKTKTMKKSCIGFEPTGAENKKNMLIDI
jgi:hypothetical protein